MFKRLNNQKGIALILVISAVIFLTFMAADFFEETQFGHQMVIVHRLRVQAYYLAKSAMNFSKLLLYYNKKVEGLLSKQNLTYTDLGFTALYHQIPINSELLRGLIEAGAAAGAEEGTEEETDTEEMAETVGLFKKQEIESFLDFKGNFDAEISEEQSKYSLNAVSKMTSTSSSYDLHKKILLSLLMREEFKTLFAYHENDAEQLVHALADYVDSNNVINEFDKVERGLEDNLYGNVPYKIKNAPYLSLSEIRMVAGVSDDIYETLKQWVTVYHSSDTVNVCLAETEIVDALIAHYTRYSECTSPLDVEDDEDDIAKLREEMLVACPDKSSVAGALNLALGIKSDAEEEASTAETKATSSKVSGCKIQFEDLLTEDNNVFRVHATGEVDGVRSTITAILDASSDQAKSWSVLYYQVD